MNASQAYFAATTTLRLLLFTVETGLKTLLLSENGALPVLLPSMQSNRDT